MYHRQLLADLSSAYQAILQSHRSQGIIMTRLDICRILSESPAPRLYISHPYARRIIIRLSHGYRYCRGHRRHAQHQELYRRYLALPPEQRRTLPLEELLSQPAPSFYLSPHRINKLLYQAILL